MTSAPGLPATILIVDDVSANRKVLPVVSLETVTRLLLLVLFGLMAVPSTAASQDPAAATEDGSAPRTQWRRLGVASIALTATLLGAPGAAAALRADTASDVAVKAALLYNFAKFVEWPVLPAGAPILGCIIGDDGIAAALVETVRGQNISGHPLEVWRPQNSNTWRVCHLLFIADGETPRFAGGLGGIKGLPVLTVSDGKGFVEAGGIIELYLEGGRMRFAINVDTAERAGLRLSSRLLRLARVVREGHAQ